MPAVTKPDGTQDPIVVPDDAFRVLLTGFGPFLNYEENPSWLSVKPLQNAILYTDLLPDALLTKPQSTAGSSYPTERSQDPALDASQPKPIHITTLKVPVIYDSVLSIVPGLHARPPVLPDDAPPECAEPPDSNYDFIFHIGVAGRGPLRMERIAHKYGYHMKDASGKLAPAVKLSTKDFRRGDGGVMRVGEGTSESSSSFGGVGGNTLSPAESMERERLGLDMVEAGGDTIARPTRGFGVGYESFPEELPTDVDVTRLVHDLKQSGVEVKRSSKPYEKRRNTQVLFLHCPPVNQPLSTEEVTDAIKRIIVWVCGQQQLHDAKDDTAIATGVSSSG
ncbi:hypothetical protein JR316_0004001 [Psilocybe cubensis]|uniref:Uncharacterized protein n=1 Tax=Psilocybe cubensis TaxID=181762 RepID=A0ACB8HBE0_PSICU|nr:hypothetical protein JR316_0004001 [Psilocybe cubensis]KAH9484519.1 hypothetical protein JR316_0004001 [Psilocybe cubensis]